MTAIPEEPGTPAYIWANVLIDEYKSEAVALMPDGLTTEQMHEVWFEAIRPRDATTPPGQAVRVVDATLSDLVPGSQAIPMRFREVAMDLVRLAGRVHRFCTEPVHSIGLGRVPGPHLCGAGLIDNDGPEVRCSHPGGHRAVIAQQDRNRFLSEAIHALERAHAEQQRTGEDEQYSNFIHYTARQLTAFAALMKEGHTDA